MSRCPNGMFDLIAITPKLTKTVSPHLSCVGPAHALFSAHVYFLMSGAASRERAFSASREAVHHLSANLRTSNGPRQPQTSKHPLRNCFAHGINKHVESSVWLVGRFCATLVARPASKVYSRKSRKSAPATGSTFGDKAPRRV